MQIKTKMRSWLCETPKEEKRVSPIFIIGSFLEICKNKRNPVIGREFRIFMSYSEIAAPQ
jgi:hypothetical protein